MAMRSLAVMLKAALPRRMPAGTRTFATKGNPWSKSSTKLTDPLEDKDFVKTWPELARNMKRSQEESDRFGRAYERDTVLIGIAGGCYICHLIYILDLFLLRTRIKEGTSKNSHQD